MEELDNIDLKILRALQKDAKLTTKELAVMVNLSATPVFERQRRLEREGYIQKYVAVLNPKKLGSGFIVLCNIRLKQHNKEYGRQFMEVVNNIEEVTDCYNTSGEYDFMMKLYVKDMEHYQDFVLNRLGDIDCIGSLHSIFVIGEVKSSQGIPILLGQ